MCYYYVSDCEIKFKYNKREMKDLVCLFFSYLLISYFIPSILYSKSMYRVIQNYD